MDVDGVLVPFGFINRDIPEADRIPDEPHQTVKTQLLGWDLEVHIPDRVIDLFHQLEEHFEIVWFTGWDGNVRKIEHVFGDTEHRLIHTHTRFSGGPRKHEALETWIENLEEDGETPSFVWIDDDELRAFTLSEFPEGCMGILVKDPEEGMTQKHVDKAIEWAKERSKNGSES
jgi:hypothetical protein